MKINSAPEMAETFTWHFAKSGHELAKDIPPADTLPENYFFSTNTTVSFKSCRSHEVRKLLEKLETKGAFVWEYSGIRMYSGIYSGYSAAGSRIARMESRYSGMRIAPKQTPTCIIPVILIPD